MTLGKSVGSLLSKVTLLRSVDAGDMRDSCNGLCAATMPTQLQREKSVTRSTNSSCPERPSLWTRVKTQIEGPSAHAQNATPSHRY
ncbi:hypothetical protein EJ02DRAFT_459257 [Clathrospora elynae]|uniref:Uncharacterized protein n=1 Tax=Clathrospora elynae TaxID=706981 RepID=A0A6A5S9Q3_9PLEO|nr:hypothetical protein EJ02DRAFT_459257 [Clathrospora elynae]